MRGISPVIATLIMIAISITAGTVAYFFNGAYEYATASGAVYGSGFPDYTAEIGVDANSSGYIDRDTGIVGYFKGLPPVADEELVECYVYVDDGTLLGWYDCFGSMTDPGSMNVTMQSVTGWLGQVGAQLHMLSGVQYNSSATIPHLTVLKSGTPLWTIETEEESYGWISGADEVMMGCGLYGDMDLTYVGAEPNTVGIRVLDTDVEPAQIVPVMPIEWTLRDSYGNALFSGNYANQSPILSQSVFLNRPNTTQTDSEKDNCLLMPSLNPHGTLEVDPGFGVPQTKQISPGQDVKFGWVKINNNYYVDDNLDGVPDNTGTIHAVVTSNFGVGQVPLPNAPVKVYDKSGCAAAYVPQSNDVAANCVSDASCTTDGNGECDMYVMPGNYFVLVEIPDNSGKYPAHTVAGVVSGGTKLARLAFKLDSSWTWTVE